VQEWIWWRGFGQGWTEWVQGQGGKGLVGKRNGVQDNSSLGKKKGFGFETGFGLKVESNTFVS
jgi:hypothetical protein